MANGISLIAKYPIGAREDNKTVPIGSNPEPICARPFSVIFRPVLKINTALWLDKSRGDVQ